MGFSDTADGMVWPPYLSRDRKCTHSRVVCLRLEGYLVITIIALFFCLLSSGTCTVASRYRVHRKTPTRLTSHGVQYGNGTHRPRGCYDVSKAGAIAIDDCDAMHDVRTRTGRVTRGQLKLSHRTIHRAANSVANTKERPLYCTPLSAAECLMR